MIRAKSSQIDGVDCYFAGYQHLCFYSLEVIFIAFYYTYPGFRKVAKYFISLDPAIIQDYDNSPSLLQCYTCVGGNPGFTTNRVGVLTSPIRDCSEHSRAFPADLS
jgi:hypothetical protein